MTIEAKARGGLLAVALAAAMIEFATSARAGEATGTLEPVMTEQLANDRAAVEAQKRVNALSDETREMLARYRQHLSETKNLETYTGQLVSQVKAQADEVVLVEKQLAELEITAREILPLIQKMLETIDQFVELDLPFQIDERRKRVAGLRDMMNRADVTISEKYRRILEAYQIETEYGRTIEAYQGQIGEGEGSRTVRFLRLGRVALLYQTMDGRESGYWDTVKKQWARDDSYRHEIQHGFNVADKKGAPDLLIAPVPAPVAGGRS